MWTKFFSLLAAFAAATALTLSNAAFAQDDHAAVGVEHDHSQMMILPLAEAPTVRFAMNPDLTGGWHLQLATERFAFAPEDADREHVAGEGHAHVYVDGVKLNRIYAPDYYLGPLPGGVHEVEVTLNTNDHMVYADDAGRIASERYLVLAPPMGEPFANITQTFDVAVQDGALVGAEETIRVTLGDGVAIRWTVDQEMELHFHGYDIEASVGPEISATILFLANIPGRFPIERHGAGSEAPILYVEVLP